MHMWNKRRENYHICHKSSPLSNWNTVFAIQNTAVALVSLHERWWPNGRPSCSELSSPLLMGILSLLMNITFIFLFLIIYSVSTLFCFLLLPSPCVAVVDCYHFLTLQPLTTALLPNDTKSSSKGILHHPIRWRSPSLSVVVRQGLTSTAKIKGPWISLPF